MNKPPKTPQTSRWLLTSLACLALAACGGGGGGGSATSTANPTVAAQVQTLKPTSAEDSVGVFIELDTTKLSAGAQSSADAQTQQRALQQAFLDQLTQVAKKPTITGASSCDVTQLTQRIKDAYLPVSGAAVRLELNGCELDLLPGMALVKGVHPDVPLAPQSSATTVSAINTAVSAINTAVKYSFNGSTAWPGYSGKTADGDGFVVAVLDTGVELNHPAIKAKLEKGACFSTPTAGGASFCPIGTADTTSANAGESCVATYGTTNRSAANAAGCGHGTSMAGVAAMNYSSGSITAGGVARSAKILPVQVFTGGISNGKASIYANSGDLLRAIEWLTSEAQRRTTANLPRIASVNMSLGGGSYAGACDTDYTGGLFKTAFANLRAQGVLPVVAAGNEGQDAAISFPGCISNVVAVGATQLSSGQIASYSNISPQVKVFAQGGDRGNTYSMPTTSSSASSLDAWASGAGTSPATAFVSGAVAVLRQLKPEATLAEIEAALQTSDKTSITDRAGQTRAIPQLRVTAAANKLLNGQSQEVPAPTPGATAPSIALNTPAPKTSVAVSETFTLNLKADDADSDLRAVVLRWTDLPTDEIKDASGKSASVSYERTFTQAGLYQWIATARDSKDNISRHLSGQVTVAEADTPTPVDDPVPPSELGVMRLCVYSQINYSGQRACGIFGQGESANFSGYWTIRSVRYLAFDMSNPGDTSKELATTLLPSVTLYNTPMARRRATEGVSVAKSTPDLTAAMPNSRVTTIQFVWNLQ